MESARTEREARRAEAQGALAELRLALAARQSALEALERLEDDREGYGAGVRAIFSKAAAAELRGVVGTVADLLEVPTGLEKAVEAVLGDRLQWVVVERFEHARAALSFLGREGAGAATLLPLETLPVPEAVPEDSSEIRWAARLVGGSRRELLHYLLGRRGDRGPPRSGGVALAAERSGRDLCHALGRGAVAHGALDRRQAGQRAGEQ